MQPVTGYVAYDVVVLIELEGGDLLTNLTVSVGSVEPNGCAQGNEEFRVRNGHRVRMSHLLAACSAEITLAAQVSKLSTVNIIIVYLFTKLIA